MLDNNRGGEGRGRGGTEGELIERYVCCSSINAIPSKVVKCP